MNVRRIVVIVFGVLVFAAVILLGLRKNGPNTFQAAFQPGGSVDMDLSAGGYDIRGTNENEIRVEVLPNEKQGVHSLISVQGNYAKVSVEGPPNNFRATIYVPEQTNLTANQTIGQLRISGVEGNKNVGLNIGQMRIQMPELESIRSVHATVMIGSVRAGPWHTGKGGILRSFRAGGKGNYSVKARLNIGDLVLE